MVMELDTKYVPITTKGEATPIFFVDHLGYTVDASVNEIRECFMLLMDSLTDDDLDRILPRDHDGMRYLENQMKRMKL